MANGAIRIPSEPIAAKLRARAVARRTPPSHPVSYHGTRIACALRVEAEVKRAHMLH